MLKAIRYSRQMKLIFLLFFVFYANHIFAETVYKTVDENGNIIFTDKPSENSEEIKLQELQTIKNPNPPRLTTSPKESTLEKESLYKSILITNPADGSGLRSNNGSVSISVSLVPPLRPGHKIIIAMDGNKVSAGSAESVSLQNVERGTHSLTASVIDGNGKKLASISSSFSLLRVSK